MTDPMCGAPANDKYNRAASVYLRVVGTVTCTMPPGHEPEDIHGALGGRWNASEVLVEPGTKKWTDHS